jgi:hypothetical protein
MVVSFELYLLLKTWLPGSTNNSPGFPEAKFPLPWQFSYPEDRLHELLLSPMKSSTFRLGSQIQETYGRSAEI